MNAIEERTETSKPLLPRLEAMENLWAEPICYLSI